MYQKKATFMEAVKSAIIENYCNFSGRASRSQYWWYQLFYCVAFFALYFLSIIGGVIGSSIDSDFGALVFIIFYGLIWILILALALPSLGILVRRLHDVGKSGWWYFINLIPFGGLYLLYLTVQDSEPEANEWGDVPMMYYDQYDQYDNGSYGYEGGYKY